MNNGIIPMTILDLLQLHKSVQVVNIIMSVTYIHSYMCVHILMLFTFKAYKILLLCFRF